uniref:Lipid-binding serum glycoprotein N-terminal domain-containing protein n=1 Tax=Cuerna arida TaxID=1464854 RepID=A0A1B6FGM3_9HEMI
MGAFYIVIASVLVNVFAQHVNVNIDSILPSSEAKEWRIQDYMGYLQQILSDDRHKLGNFQLSFPRALVYDGLTLRNGRITQYLTPTIPFGFYDRVMFHAKKNELFGVFQLYAPVMEIVYDFPGGQLTMTVTHGPVQIHMGIGTVNGGACRIERGHHDAFYFLDGRLKVDAQFSPNEFNSGQQIVNEMSKTWLPLLYKIIFDIRMQMFVSREKEKLLQNQKQYPLVSNICTSIS